MVKRENVKINDCVVCGTRNGFMYGSTVVCSQCGEEETKQIRSIEYGTF